MARWALFATSCPGFFPKWLLSARLAGSLTRRRPPTTYEALDLVCSRRRRTFVASLDAKLEGALVRDWERRDLRLWLHARRSETARSFAKTHRSPSRSITPRAGATSR